MRCSRRWRGFRGGAVAAAGGGAYPLGLLSQAERENGWTIAELAGDWSPPEMQRLLNFYTWDEDAARDALRSYVTRGLGDPGAVLAVDETGFLKKGKMSACVSLALTRQPSAITGGPAPGAA